MVLQISKPGVNITQTFAGTPITPVAPALVPCVVGPSFQVVDIIDENGAMADAAKSEVSYDQGPLSISVSSFPAPFTQDMVVLPDEVLVATQVPGLGTADFLSRTSAFLTDLPDAYAPALFIPTPVASTLIADLGIRLYGNVAQASNADLSFSLAGTAGTLSAEFVGDTLTLTLPRADTQVDAIVAEINDLGLGLTAASTGALDAVGHTSTLSTALSRVVLSPTQYATSKLIYALDIANEANVSSDIILDISANSSPDDIANAINTNVTSPRATARVYNGRPGVLLYSSRIGAAGKVVLRDQNGSTNNTFARLCLGGASSSALSGTVVVRGAGLYANQTDASSNVSDQIKFSAGTKDNVGLGTALWHIDGGRLTSTISAPDFLGQYLLRGATSTRDGDLLTVVAPVGMGLSSVMVRDVRSDSFRLCTIDAALSVYNTDGGIVSQRYAPLRVGILSNLEFFAPSKAFVVAQGLSSYIEDADSVNYRAAKRSVALSTVRGFAKASSASVTWTPPNLAAVRGLSGDIVVTVDGLQRSFTYTVPTLGDLAEVANDIAAQFNAGAPETHLISASVADGTDLIVSTQRKAADVSLTLSPSPLWAAGVFDPVGTNADQGSDNTLSDDFNSQELRFSFNGHSAAKYTPEGASLDKFVMDVNEKLKYVALSVEEFDIDDDVNTAKTLHLVVRSPLVGIASSVSIDTSSGIGQLLFSDGANIAPTPTRPNPELRVRADGGLDISPEVLRSPLNGKPASGSRPVYIGYRALRLDVTASAENAAPIEVSSLDDLQANYGPITARNPLGLAMFFALTNGGAGQTVTALGVDSISDAEPEGTTVAYAEAFELLRGFEIHTLVPLTHSEDVIALADAHVKDMSEPDNRMERTCIASPLNPLRENDTALLSTTDTGASNGPSAGLVIVDENPTAAIEAKAIDTSEMIPFETSAGEQLYISVRIGSAVYRRSVKYVSGATVTTRSANELTSLQNADGFYTTDELPSEFAGAEYTIALRGKTLFDSRGLLLRSKYAETIRNKAQQYANRRQLRLYPESVQSSAVGGIQQSLPSYYWGVALAAAGANALASQPFTRVPLVGFNGVDGPRLERAHLDIISAGTAVIEIDRVGEAPALRLQSTTDVSSIETREWSVTRAVDLFAKRVRAGVLGRIGRFNITAAYIDDLRLLLTGICSATQGEGVLRSALVSSISQNSAQPDTVDIVLTVEVLYPANYINVTISV